VGTFHWCTCAIDYPLLSGDLPSQHPTTSPGSAPHFYRSRVQTANYSLTATQRRRCHHHHTHHHLPPCTHTLPNMLRNTGKRSSFLSLFKRKPSTAKATTLGKALVETPVRLREEAPSVFLQPTTSSSLAARRQKAKRAAQPARATSWPVATATSTSTSTSANRLTGDAENAALNQELMVTGSAPASPSGSSPGLTLASLSLGNLKTSSLHQRRRTKQRMQQQVGGNTSAAERRTKLDRRRLVVSESFCPHQAGVAQLQPWSPMLNLTMSPPDSPLWGFGGTPTMAAAPTTTTTTSESWAGVQFGFAGELDEDGARSSWTSSPHTAPASFC
jgi:hypothetical protein